MNRAANKRTRGRPAARRGAALLEFVMVFPFMGVLLGLIFFFGFAMTNQQNVKATDRYLCWRSIRGAESLDHAGQSWHKVLNRRMFDDKAGHISRSSRQGPVETLEDLVERVGEFSQRAQTLAEEATDGWPKSRSQKVSANFPTDVTLWEWFKGSIRNRHDREGNEWYRGKVSYLEPIRNQFLSDLDETVRSIPDGKLQGNIRKLYTKRW